MATKISPNLFVYLFLFFSVLEFCNCLPVNSNEPQEDGDKSQNNDWRDLSEENANINQDGNITGDEKENEEDDKATEDGEINETQTTEGEDEAIEDDDENEGTESDEEEITESIDEENQESDEEDSDDDSEEYEVGTLMEPPTPTASTPTEESETTSDSE